MDTLSNEPWSLDSTRKTVPAFEISMLRLLNDQFSVQEFGSKFWTKNFHSQQKRERGKKLVECELGRDIIYLDDAQCRDNRWMPALNCEARERERKKERERKRGEMRKTGKNVKKVTRRWPDLGIEFVFIRSHLNDCLDFFIPRCWEASFRDFLANSWLLFSQK